MLCLDYKWSLTNLACYSKVKHEDMIWILEYSDVILKQLNIYWKDELNWIKLNNQWVIYTSIKWLRG